MKTQQRRCYFFAGLVPRWPPFASKSSWIVFVLTSKEAQQILQTDHWSPDDLTLFRNYRSTRQTYREWNSRRSPTEISGLSMWLGRTEASPPEVPAAFLRRSGSENIYHFIKNSKKYLVNYIINANLPCGLVGLSFERAFLNESERAGGSYISIPSLNTEH